jgi:Phosphatidylinositol-4-phosphate 5-Kinase
MIFLLSKFFPILIIDRAFAPKENQEAMAKFGEGSGKSASFFFFTENKQFVIKTLKDEELELLAKKGLLEKYYTYLKSNPNSLLARFYGIFTVKIKFMKPINIIIMDNFVGKHEEYMTRMYDLKGVHVPKNYHKPCITQDSQEGSQLPGGP